MGTAQPVHAPRDPRMSTFRFCSVQAGGRPPKQPVRNVLSFPPRRSLPVSAPLHGEVSGFRTTRFQNWRGLHAPSVSGPRGDGGGGGPQGTTQRWSPTSTSLLFPMIPCSAPIVHSPGRKTGGFSLGPDVTPGGHPTVLSTDLMDCLVPVRPIPVPKPFPPPP